MAKAARNRQSRSARRRSGSASAKAVRAGAASTKGAAAKAGKAAKGKPASRWQRARQQTRQARQGRERGRTRRFIHDVRVELSKVTWPTRKDLTQSTIVVIVAVGIAAAFTFALDEVFSRLVDAILKLVH